MQSAYQGERMQYGCVFDDAIHKNKADWSIMADTSKNCDSFSIYLKFFGLEDCTLLPRFY